jgi:superfamily II DNA or RNA helicase
MAPRYRWRHPQGRHTITTIVKKLLPQWKDGLYPEQHDLVMRVLDGESILCCMATGAGKSPCRVFVPPNPDWKTLREQICVI